MTPPRYPCGHINLPRLAANLSLELHPVQTALINTAEIVSEMREQLPARGPLVDLVNELIDQLAYVEAAHHTANETMLDVAMLCRVEDACHWVPEQFDELANEPRT